MLNRILHISVLLLALAATAAAQNPYLQGSLSGGTGVPGSKTRSALNTMERAAGSLAGATILTDTFGNQRLALFVHIEDTCINFTPAATGNTTNLSAFVEKCSTDSVWYIDWEGKSQFIGGAGAVCDQDWLQISDNSCPDAITDSIYHYRYAAIGARLVWPTAEFLVSDSSAVQVTVLSGNRNSRLAFYDNVNQVSSTIDQSGAQTIWYIEPTGEMRWTTAGGGTPQAPGAPFINQFAINPTDSTIQAHLYPRTRTDTNSVYNFLYTDNLGKFRSQSIDTLIQIIYDSLLIDTALAVNWYTTNGTTTDLGRTALVKRTAIWLGVDTVGFLRHQVGLLDGARATVFQDSVTLLRFGSTYTNYITVGDSSINIATSGPNPQAVNIRTDTINFYDNYYWAQGAPSFTVGDTSLHFWAGNGIGTNPGFMLLEDVVSANNGLNENIENNIQMGGPFVQNTTIGDITQNFGLTISRIGTGAAATLAAVSNTGVAVNSTSTSGNALISTSTSGLAGIFTVNPASTNSVAEVARLARTTSGTAAAGIGGGLYYTLEADDGSQQLSGIVASTWTDPALATRTSNLQFYTTNSATNAVKATLSGPGALRLHNYGAGTFTGTPTYTLQVDASGNVIEGAVGGSGDVLQNGNSFGAAMVIGTNDDNTFSFETNGVTRSTITTGASTGGQWTMTNVTANTNTVSDIMTLQTNSTGTAAASFGGGILFQGESSTTDNRDMVRLSAIWTTATDASRASALVYSDVTAAGALTERFRFTPNAMTIATSYAIGNSSSALTLGGSSGTVTISTTSSSTTGINLLSNSTAGSVAFYGGITISPTSGTKNWVDIGGSFTPGSGTGVCNFLTLTQTINQTGGANGITRGIYLNQTLTAVADFRGIEIAYSNSAAKGVYQTGANTTNNFVGATGFGATTAPTDKVEITGNLALLVAGNKLKIATGANASVGTSAAMTAGSITINTTAVTASSQIFLTHATLGGTQGILSVGIITAGTSFVINSSNAADTGTVNWLIIN